MKLVIFGLTISSSWGNGHATIWRSLCRTWLALGHEFIFFERDTPYYRAKRDLTTLPKGGRLILYSSWDEVEASAKAELEDADVGMITSYCPDGVRASELVISREDLLPVFYDLDTPVTLEKWWKGEPLTYIGPRGLEDFHLVLSYTGGFALEEVKRVLKAKVVAPLYGSVDPGAHLPVPKNSWYECDLSYLGTYAEDRQAALNRFLIETAVRMKDRTFLIGGSMYPSDFPWKKNINFARHVTPQEHPSFYCSSKFTLNITRQSMARMGYCPSGRLFEAAACGVPVISDWWGGLDQFFNPGSEILIVNTTEDVERALNLSDEARNRIGRAARQRALDEHSCQIRARQMESMLERALNHDWEHFEQEESVLTI